jgi:pimeloyl-ACP methyl ester carboxylesterase
LVSVATALVGACNQQDQAANDLREALLDRDVDLGVLFARPTDTELEALETKWRAEDFAPEDVREEASVVLDSGDVLRVLSHLVSGQRHYGVVIEPEGAHMPGSLPVFVNLIGFGPEMRLEVPPDASAYDGAAVTILPSFRGHELLVGEDSWRSEGDPFDQCDGGTDDALAFLAVALSTTPAADPDRIVLFGGSRGGNVAMMMGIRRPDVAGAVSLAGPTDYLQGPLLDNLNMVPTYANYFLANLLDGGSNVDEARERILSCSPLYFADALPPLQLHHGTADVNVPVAQSESLRDRLRSLGRVSPDYELFIYEGADHQLTNALDAISPRVEQFFRARSVP